VEVQLNNLPFPHNILAPVVAREVAVALLNGLETAEWERRASTFYRFDIPRVGSFRSSVREILLDTSEQIKRECENSLGLSLSQASSFEIHRYSIGDGIGPHTDARDQEVRCILNLNSGWSSEQGNVWVFSSDSALSTNRALLPSINNTAYTFATDPTSYHALSVRRYGVGYAVTIRFRRK
jgi:hypothetical protein